MIRRTTGAAAAAVAALACALTPSGASAAPSCRATHWVGAWSAAPTNAYRGTRPTDRVDASLNVITAAVNDTTRAILTPTLGGSTLRVRLTNRFGTKPVTFAHVTVARRSTGADLVPGTTRELRFGGRPSITVAPGRDVVSDGVALPVRAFQDLAVDVYVREDAGVPTMHYAARQTSFITPDGAGDHAGEVAGAAFTQRTTSRPWVMGIDVQASRRTGAVVALGDSVTDGYDGKILGLPEDRAGVDANGRYTDVLARRLRAAKRPLGVLNMGITGDTVLKEASASNVPSALARLDRDVLRQEGVTTVVWMEGINDLRATPTPSVQQLIAGWTRGIRRMHARGLKVVMATLPPANSTDTSPTGLEGKRQALNRWIRRTRVHDGVADFDAAVRDPALPVRVKPAYRGSDFLHLNLEGNRAIANAIRLRLLRTPTCR